MKMLHIIRKTDDKFPIRQIEFEKNDNEVSLLLIQDGVLSKIDIDVNIYVNKEDLDARGKDSQYKKIDYDEIRYLIVNNDRVIIW